MRRRKTNNRQLTKEKELFWAVAAGNYRLRPLLLPFEHISTSRSRISRHCRSSRNKKQFRNGCKVMLSVELTMTNYEQQKYEISAEWNRQRNAKIICMNSDAKLFKSKHDVKFVFEKKKMFINLSVFPPCFSKMESACCHSAVSEEKIWPGESLDARKQFRMPDKISTAHSGAEMSTE